MVLYEVSVFWSAWVLVSYYGFGYFNLWCVANGIMWVLWLFLNFYIAFSCCNLRTNSVLRSLAIPPPRRNPYIDVVVGIVWSHDPESCAGGSLLLLGSPTPDRSKVMIQTKRDALKINVTPNFKTMVRGHGNIKSYLCKYKILDKPNVFLQKRRTNGRPHIVWL
jgi:hypothetical protein